MNIRAILCADWSKDPKRRAVYVADVSNRTVSRAESTTRWTLGGIIAHAKRLAVGGPVLAAIDAPFGLPKSYLTAAARNPLWNASENFLDFLRQIYRSPEFFAETHVASEWRVEQPFFSVPKGAGGLASYHDAASRNGVDLYRAIDVRTSAKPLFATSGIPGTVGCSARALWQELGQLLQEDDRRFRVWPFDGDLDVLLESSPVVLAEIYPRAAYATALRDGPIESRAALKLAKTDPSVRDSAINALLAMNWAVAHNVHFEHLDCAGNSEDDFDACITAAALLRCELERLPLHASSPAPDLAEGGILGTGTVNLALPEQMFSSRAGAVRSRLPQQLEAVGATFRCPIPLCPKIYKNSRGGWDGHICSLQTHPDWHPELTSAEARKRQFKAEFSDFFESL